MPIFPGLIILFFLILIVVGLIILQIWLSRAESKWPGLILPALTFLLTLSISLGTVLYNSTFSPRLETVDENGVTHTIDTYVYNASDPIVTRTSPSAYAILYMFFISNIPTIILLAIYICMRSNYRRKKQLEKMRIQDL